MDKVSKILGRALAKRGLTKSAEGAQVCFWAKKWAKGRFEPISFSDETLKVSVDSSSAAQELSMDREKLIKHLNLKAGKEKVRKVRIVNSQ